MSIGQLYFMSELLHSHHNRPNLDPALLYDFIDHAWRVGPYHLRLSISHVVFSCARSLSEPDRVRYAALVETWLSDDGWMNGIVLDALKALDAFEDAFSVEEAVGEFRSVLALPSSQVSAEAAYRIWSNIFDHPYDAIYYQGYDQLLEAEKAELLTRALNADSRYSMFHAFLLSEVARRPSPAMVPALTKFALYPRQDTSSYQDAIDVFQHAVEALAKLGAPMPDELPGDDEIQRAWRHARRILFILQRPNISREDYIEETNDDWRQLINLRAIDLIMRLISSRYRPSDTDTTRKIIAWSSRSILTLSRNALSDDRPPFSAFRMHSKWPNVSHEITEYALGIIEEFGDRSDLKRIEHLLDDLTFGKRAIRAARAIEGR